MTYDAHIYQTRSGMWRARVTIGTTRVYTRSIRSIAAVSHAICVIINDHDKAAKKRGDNGGAE